MVSALYFFTAKLAKSAKVFLVRFAFFAVRFPTLRETGHNGTEIFYTEFTRL